MHAPYRVQDTGAGLENIQIRDRGAARGLAATGASATTVPEQALHGVVVFDEPVKAAVLGFPRDLRPGADLREQVDRHAAVHIEDVFAAGTIEERHRREQLRATEDTATLNLLRRPREAAYRERELVAAREPRLRGTKRYVVR